MSDADTREPEREEPGREATGGEGAPKQEPSARAGRQLPVPGLRAVPIPSMGDALYLGGIAALAAMELVDWPVALALAVGHELVTRLARPVAPAPRAA